MITRNNCRSLTVPQSRYSNFLNTSANSTSDTVIQNYLYHTDHVRGEHDRQNRIIYVSFIDLVSYNTILSSTFLSPFFYTYACVYFTRFFLFTIFCIYVHLRVCFLYTFFFSIYVFYKSPLRWGRYILYLWC